MRTKLSYTKRRLWKYKLRNDITFTIRSYDFEVLLEDLIGGTDFDHEYFSIKLFPRTSVIEISIKAQYCWDGVTGGPDLDRFLPASLLHDVIIQLCNYSFPLQGVHLSNKQRKEFKKYGDLAFKHQLLSDGVNKIIATIMHQAVELAAKYDNRVKTI